MITHKPIFNIGDHVYHVTDMESGRAVIINIHYNYASDEHTYRCSFGPHIEQEVILLGMELSKSKSVF